MRRLIPFFILLSSAVAAEILDEDVAPGAEVSLLRQELTVFTSIHNGVLLSVAECELSDSCDASVSRTEIEAIIGTINNRVNTLSVRYLDSNDAELENVLIAYADARDDYNAILEKLAAMPQFYRQEETVADDLVTDDAFLNRGAGGGVSAELLRLYEDIDEEIVDDELMIEDDLTVPE